MRITLPDDLDPSERTAVHQRVRLALGPHIARVRRVDVSGTGEHGGFRVSLRIACDAEPPLNIDTWHREPIGALDQVLARGRRALDRYRPRL
ncbi:MAG: hypothetical protein PF961_04355 [Planctomycetota bacterium]|nr:hypothetical protein [Planctomycetota bacterium]